MITSKKFSLRQIKPKEEYQIQATDNPPISRPHQSQRKLTPCLPPQMITAIRSPSLHEIKKARDENLVLRVLLERLKSPASTAKSDFKSAGRDKIIEQNLKTKRKKHKGSMFSAELWSESYMKKFVTRDEYITSKEKARKIIQESTRSTESYRKDLENYFQERNPAYSKEGQLIRHLIEEEPEDSEEKEPLKIVIDFQSKDVVYLAKANPPSENRIASASTTMTDVFTNQEAHQKTNSFDKESTARTHTILPSIDAKTPSIKFINSETVYIPRPKSTCTASIIGSPQTFSQDFVENIPPKRDAKRVYSTTSLDDDIQGQSAHLLSPEQSNADKSSFRIRTPLQSISLSNSRLQTLCPNSNELEKSTHRFNFADTIKPKRLFQDDQNTAPTVCVQPCLREKLLKNRAQTMKRATLSAQSGGNKFFRHLTQPKKLWHP